MDAMIAYYVTFQNQLEDGGYHQIVVPYKLDGCMDGYGGAPALIVLILYGRR